MNTQIQYLEIDGQTEFAVVPIDTCRHLLDLAGNAEDIRAADRAVRELEKGEDELIPADVVRRLVTGDSPVRVWRNHRGGTRDDGRYWETLHLPD